MSTTTLMLVRGDFALRLAPGHPSLVHTGPRIPAPDEVTFLLLALAEVTFSLLALEEVMFSLLVPGEVTVSLLIPEEVTVSVVLTTRPTPGLKIDQHQTTYRVKFGF